ncbi:SMP-30/gluconolactonase/LRE family protein [uncultured Sphingomonas sp.]|uniref:SMP-30/gluconolactonase/LRE family protein n=1 Tax=uncultured Sphingomonas sp. TaxID=158754 RepID=UPI00262759F5|nr:SMP-30/gluconolactonase/LRE family protein [uncultured Sphingomonas sp.]
MAMAVTRALDAGNHLGEMPVWSVAEQALWWINCEHPPELHRWHPVSGRHDRFAMPERIGGFVRKADGDLLVVLADGLHDFAPATGTLSLRVSTPLPPEVLLHECACDRQGRLWVGGFDKRFPADRDAKGASWFRLDGDTLTPVIRGIAVANGLAFSPDGRTLYAGMSPRRAVDAFDLDPATGAVSNQRTFLTLEPGHGHVDGATVDAEGGYWLAVVAAAELRRYRPDGRLDRVVPLPFANPTKPAFGGPDLATLYITSTQMRIEPATPGADLNGGLFALTPGERGMADTLLFR